MNLISGRAGLFIIIATFNLNVIFGTKVDQRIPEGSNLTTVEIIKKYGYPVETHTTESEDGYYLTLHRIPHGKNSKKPGLPILAAHGIFSDSSQFVRYENESLGFFLADRGYDVWLINFRGNHYTRTHKYLTTDDSKFWDFSLQEHGAYDLPAYINYICNYTKKQELFFLGYSMGTTAFLVLGSERPEYQKHIKGAVLLAPVSTMKYTKFPIRVLATFGSILKVLSDIKSHGEFYIDYNAYQKFVELICPSTSPVSKLCEHAFFALTSGVLTKFDEGRPKRVPIHYPSSTSTKVIAHYAQLIQSGQFRQYDYGILHNLIVYKYKSPPKYNLNSITTPISVFVAPNDILATPKGVKETLSALPSVENIFVVPDKYFGHGNFISGKDNKRVLYPEIARQIENLIRDGNVSQELPLINTFSRVHGNEVYHTEDSFKATPIEIQDSERDHAEHSVIKTSENTHGKENYPTDNFFSNTPLQVYGSERDPLDSFIKTPEKVYGKENYPVEDYFISTPQRVHGSEKDPLQDSFIDIAKNVPGQEKYPAEDSSINIPFQVYGSERNPLEDSFIHTHNTVHGNENDPAERYLQSNFRKAHGRKKHPARHFFNHNFISDHDRKNDPEEYHNKPLIHYMY